jgi:hypothetical protein
MGIGTNLIYIFECKNYTKHKVDKNDIVDFYDKINVLNCQKGYFIAKNYTKDAINKAKEFDRIELLYFSELSKLNGINIEIENQFLSEIQINYLGFNKNNNEVIFHNIDENDILEYEGGKITIKEMVFVNVGNNQHVLNQYEKKFNKKETYNIINFTLNLSPSNEIKYILFKGKKYENMFFNVNLIFKIEQAKLNYHYNIDSKGSYFEIELKSMYNKNIISKNRFVYKNFELHWLADIEEVNISSN